jgi:hypothetical protein
MSGIGRSTVTSGVFVALACAAPEVREDKPEPVIVRAEEPLPEIAPGLPLVAWEGDKLRWCVAVRGPVAAPGKRFRAKVERGRRAIAQAESDRPLAIKEGVVALIGDCDVAGARPPGAVPLEGAEPGDYTLRLQIESAAGWRDLATTPFTLKQAAGLGEMTFAAEPRTPVRARYGPGGRPVVNVEVPIDERPTLVIAFLRRAGDVVAEEVIELKGDEPVFPGQPFVEKRRFVLREPGFRIQLAGDYELAVYRRAQFQFICRFSAEDGGAVVGASAVERASWSALDCEGPPPDDEPALAARAGAKKPKSGKDWYRPLELRALEKSAEARKLKRELAPHGDSPPRALLYKYDNLVRAIGKAQ